MTGREETGTRCTHSRPDRTSVHCLSPEVVAGVDSWDSSPTVVVLSGSELGRESVFRRVAKGSSLRRRFELQVLGREGESSSHRNHRNELERPRARGADTLLVPLHGTPRLLQRVRSCVCRPETPTDRGGPAVGVGRDRQSSGRSRVRGRTRRRLCPDVRRRYPGPGKT